MLVEFRGRLREIDGIQYISITEDDAKILVAELIRESNAESASRQTARMIQEIFAEDDVVSDQFPAIVYWTT